MRFRRRGKDDLPDGLIPWERARPSERPVEVGESDVRNGNIMNSVHSRHDEFSLDELTEVLSSSWIYWRKKT